VIGKDFPARYLQWLDHERIDLSGLERRKGRTFRWAGRYHEDMNVRDTLALELNVMGEAPPAVPAAFRDSELVFLSVTTPEAQLDLLGQVNRPRLAVADTIHHYIEHNREELMALVRRVDGLVINDEEARMLTGDRRLPAAGRMLCTWGPRFAVIKKGEHGCLLATRRRCANLPAYPAERVVDPTGAGDSFAGAMMGSLAACTRITDTALRRALACGTVVASFTIEGFSVERLRSVTRQDIDRRLAELRQMVRF
jgi:sugar/nucleoside kinase (ribokinase family)